MNVILSSILGAVLFGAASLSAAGEMERMTHKHHFRAVGEIDVMTQNQYLGADLGPVLAAAISNPSNMNAAVVDSLGKIAASRPAERVRALAEQIAQRNPDVVGLQEVYKFECMPDTEHGFPPEMGKGCDDLAIKGAFTDHLQDTEAALAELGSKYRVAGQVTNLKVDAVPFRVNNYGALLSIADRDAILVRAELSDKWVNFALVGLCPKPSYEGCNYQTAPPPFPTPVGDIAIERGFLAVDVTIKGRVYRVFNTHLEQRLLAEGLTDTRLLQVLQASELLGIALGTWDGSKKMIIVGDINSDPRDRFLAPPPPPSPYLTPYEMFTFNNVFWDTWTLRYHQRPGRTCCQAGDLENHRSELYERIDMIFSHTPPLRVLDMELIGEKKRDKTDPPPKGGLWPSDHAALAATLRFK
ncbi:MAG: hypothetical protein OEV01_08505 [Nitrospira sp.]|nr:hypothetical protein [Nitrospira sp.]MDH5193542.1 hypothetical protein [Nitrospira sp.]